MTDLAAPVIHAAGLTKRFGELEAVKGIDLDVQPGEIFGFLGPNGAGKTTTISILCTLLRPTAGRPASRASTSTGAGRRAGPDRARLPGPVARPAAHGAREPASSTPSSIGVPPPCERQRIDEVLEMVELADRADAPVQTFSGGMRRRLEIARGILHTPEVLFLDEPTIGLDPQTRRHIWAYLSDCRDERE